MVQFGNMSIDNFKRIVQIIHVGFKFHAVSYSLTIKNYIKWKFFVCLNEATVPHIKKMVQFGNMSINNY